MSFTTSTRTFNGFFLFHAPDSCVALHADSCVALCCKNGCVHGLSESEVVTTRDTVWAMTYKQQRTCGFLPILQQSTATTPASLPTQFVASQCASKHGCLRQTYRRAGTMRSGEIFWMGTWGTTVHHTPVSLWRLKWQCSGCRCMLMKMGTSSQMLRKFFFHQVWRNVWCMISMQKNTRNPVTLNLFQALGEYLLTYHHSKGIQRSIICNYTFQKHTKCLHAHIPEQRPESKVTTQLILHAIVWCQHCDKIAMQ